MYEDKLGVWATFRRCLLSRCGLVLKDCCLVNTRADKLQWRGPVQSAFSIVQCLLLGCSWVNTNRHISQEGKLPYSPQIHAKQQNNTNNREFKGKKKTKTKTPWQQNKLESNIKLKQIPMNSSWFFWRQWNETARNSKISCRIHLKYNARQAWEEKSTKKTGGLA